MYGMKWIIVPARANKTDVNVGGIFKAGEL